MGNPWAGIVRCPLCGSDRYTLPWDVARLPEWRCIRCHRDLTRTGRNTAVPA